jgi:pentatricopeptide repeat protein
MAEMRGNGLAPNVITYNALIRACGKSGQWQLSLKVFREMAKEDVAPNTFTFNSLITSCNTGWQVRATPTVLSLALLAWHCCVRASLLRRRSHLSAVRRRSWYSDAKVANRNVRDSGWALTRPFRDARRIPSAGL